MNTQISEIDIINDSTELEISYDVDIIPKKIDIELVWGCYAGCCTNVDRGIEY